MGTRLELQNLLEGFVPNVYYQAPPNNIMIYPCIVYKRDDRIRNYGNNQIYIKKQGYQLTLIERNPDSTVGDYIEEYFEYCAITQNYVVDNLYHTTLNLYF